MDLTLKSRFSVTSDLMVEKCLGKKKGDPELILADLEHLELSQTGF